MPKQFLRVIGGETLLDATLERARRFAADDRIWVVCGAEHARLVRQATGLPPSRILVEPRRRNTAMAAAWAAHCVARVDPDAVLAVLPADHHVPDRTAFARDMRLAARVAQRSEALVTIGVEPTRPETGYGYIQAGDPLEGFEGVFRVRRFVEKPDLKTAKRYVARGDYRWNAGIFVWPAATLLSEIERWCPELHRALAPFRPAPRSTRGARRPRASSRQAVEAAFRRAPSLPVDVAVMERSGRVLTVPASFRWSDVGSWASLAEELGVGEPGRTGAERQGNRVIGGEALFEAAEGNLVWAGDRLVALLGVEDLVVVDTEDVTLVTKRDASSDVKRVLERLRKQGRHDLT